MMIMNTRLYRLISTSTVPIAATFVASLLLSALAQWNTTINRDGMLYVVTAQVFLDEGFSAALAHFSWPFMSIAIAVFSWLTGLDLETSGYLLNAFFMAGACALMVACVIRQAPGMGWLSFLAVLTVPGVNEYRNELLREFGCWFFIMLAFWLALRWEQRPSWLGALPIQLALIVAALFRPEALTLFAALIAWQISSAPREARWSRSTMLGALPVIAGVLLLGQYLSGNLGSGRLAGEFSRLSIERFDAKAQVLAGELIVHARENAHAILLLGSLSLIPLKLVSKFGILLMPMAFLLTKSHFRNTHRAFPLFSWAIIIHLMVLVVYVTDMHFLAGRYVGPVLLFSVPFITAGLALTLDRWPSWRWVVVGMSILLALANVISTSPSKVHFVEAGQWLATHTHASNSVYIDSERTAYHAGWLRKTVAERNHRDNILRAVDAGSHELYVLELSRKDPQDEAWMEVAGLRVIQRFGIRGKDEVLIAVPVGTPSPG
ncbi:MAG: hypothetical protein FJ209_10280 [Betaproteobacteria bacterium]|nr:hypothetical protein [Betaproteobacteria bacterium]